MTVSQREITQMTITLTHFFSKLWEALLLQCSILWNNELIKN